MMCFNVTAPKGTVEHPKSPNESNTKTNNTIVKSELELINSCRKGTSLGVRMISASNIFKALNSASYQAKDSCHTCKDH